MALTDGAGTVHTEYTYAPFGETTRTGTVATNPFQFTGRESDGTGLYYYRARYYHPILQRFMSEDPIGFAGGDVNLYAYVGDSPVNFVDPWGLDRLELRGGTLSWFNDLEQFVQDYPAVSGPHGRGRLPKGSYTGSNLRRRTTPAMTCPGDRGWSLNLDPNFETERDLLRIHPDGNVPGTEGCIGISCGSLAADLYNDLKNYFDAGNTEIPVGVK